MQTGVTWARRALARSLALELLGLAAAVMLSCGPSKPSEQEFCEDAMRVYCEQIIECWPLGAAAIGLYDKSECAPLAVLWCSDDGSDPADPEDPADDCQPTSMPSASDYDDCLDQIEGASCGLSFWTAASTGACAELYAAIECSGE